jgi:hypothetical protein
VGAAAGVLFRRRYPRRNRFPSADDEADEEELHALES